MIGPAEAPPRIIAKLGPLIGVNQDMPGLASTHGHEKCVQYKILSQCGLGGPADNAARVQVHHDDQIEPALPGAHVCNIGNPAVLGRGTVKPRCSVSGVRSDAGLLVYRGARYPCRAFRSLAFMIRATRCLLHGSPASRNSRKIRGAP